MDLLQLAVNLSAEIETTWAALWSSSLVSSMVLKSMLADVSFVATALQSSLIMVLISVIWSAKSVVGGRCCWLLCVLLEHVAGGISGVGPLLLGRTSESSSRATAQMASAPRAVIPEIECLRWSRTVLREDGLGC